MIRDFRLAAERRRFYLARGMRKPPIGSGGDLHHLMRLPRTELIVKPKDIFGELPVLVVGGVATRAYAPERHTKDIDFLVEDERKATISIFPTRRLDCTAKPGRADTRNWILSRLPKTGAVPRF